ncbi:glycosyltransferase family 39 protein [Candidatus Microgenomates bacterium]|nr:glycosyltransferase family 39 protein [Candidatus Microgenomates bacterium]
MPLFNFIYQLPYFIASLFIFIGAGLTTAFKLTLALSYLLSAIFMLAFTRQFFKDDQKALLVTIFYQFAPFRLVELLIRGSFGEVYTYAFLPLALWGMILFLQKKTYRNFLLTGFGVALLVLSHNSVSLLFFAIILLFLIFFAKTKKNFTVGSLALLLGLLLSSFYWLPAIMEHKYTHGNLYMRNVYLDYFVPLWQFFVPNFLNSKIFQTEGISVQFGLFHEIALVASIWFLLKKKLDEKSKKIIYFCLVLIVGSLLFTQSISKIIWANISLIRQFQFPWRFLSVAVLGSALLSVNYLSLAIFKKKAAYIILLVMVIFSTAYYWKPQLGVDKIDEAYYWNFPLNTTYYGETDVVWSAGPAKEYPKERVEIIGGEGGIKNFYKKSNLHTFAVNAKTDIVIVDHTQYFPGWRVFIDNLPVPIQFQDANWRGEITFSVPKGEHIVKVVFGESKLRLVADIISMASLAGVLLLGIFKARVKI